MIFDELVLHDFGAYGGRQSITLTPTGPDKPIVLFGGMNGGGKTTMLDAIQLCLYGVLASTSNRTGSYHTYLDRSIHRAPGVNGAAIELAFSQNSGGSCQNLRLHRSWSRGPSGIRERLELLRDGEPDDLATEHWGEQVEEFIPARISQLFLFDGEKIEAYADFEGTSRLIATAVQSLLGLDVVEQLLADLKAIERKKRVSDAPTGEDVELERVAEELAGSQERHRVQHQEVAGLLNEVDRLRRDLEHVDEEFRRRGGHLLDRRSDIDIRLTAASGDVDRGRDRLRELAAGSAPLLMLSDAVGRVLGRDVEERARARAESVREAVLQEFDLLEGLFSGSTFAEGAAAILADRRRALVRQATDRRPGALLPDACLSQAQWLVERGFNEEAARLRTARQEVVGARRLLKAVEDERAAVPAEESMADLVGRRRMAQDALEAGVSRHRDGRQALDALLVKVDGLRRREAALMEKTARRRFEREDLARMLRHSTRARTTLGRFRERIVVRHIDTIQRQILRSLGALTGKADLIGDVRIDPQTYALELRGRDGQVLPPERLSAGERQILAVSVLWGLARSSRRPLPTVIDTPLGRLDSVHRRHLVQRYFPVASHQVLLLSTDQEIVDANLAELSRSVGRSYRLAHDPVAGATVVEPGYFGDAA